MDLFITNSQKKCYGELEISGSKSESNRLLIIKSFIPNIEIQNLSNSDDTILLLNALSSKKSILDIKHAGTAMRFLTAFFATQPKKKVLLTGSERMKERPIGVLVDALKKIGADISYDGHSGFPPLKINGKIIKGGELSLSSNVSSQFISAILLISPFLENGITLKLNGKITSLPYIEMTLSILKKIGVIYNFKNNVIKIEKFDRIKENLIVVESDWSSASYYYSCVALSDNAELKLTRFYDKSIQGDSILIDLYKNFGVESRIKDGALYLRKIKKIKVKNSMDFNLINCPDLAQTIAVTSFGVGVECNLYGLHTLRVKETDRLEALHTELSKLGANVKITRDSLHIYQSESIFSNIKIKTYNDHRMALAFAPLALKVPIQIENYKVVSKSFPTFWEDMESIGFQVIKNEY
ncbi:MAG: 3-phosphoshikimate 1-carboxyvinyltransferase [Flavobacteriaceae bacterium]|nr:3-phosphoshikimate 1-carboxyvinyltransferase [Flavobacteriaceae bacterium]